MTYDDDFRDDFSEDEYHAVLYLPDQTLTAEQIADALHDISTDDEHSERRGFIVIGRSWL